MHVASVDQFYLYKLTESKSIEKEAVMIFLKRGDRETNPTGQSNCDALTLGQT